MRREQSSHIAIIESSHIIGRRLVVVFSLLLLSSSSAFVTTVPPLQRKLLKARRRTHHPSSSSSSTSSTTAIMGIRGFRAWFESQFPDAMTSIPKENSNDTFDHVLVDMNSLLHVCLRKSRSDGHGLTLLMKELDAVVELATPTQSLVLAMDGAPSAAKLATQRKRRNAMVSKAEWKLKHLDKLGRQRLKPKQLARKKRRAAAESRTICISPGTEFMHKAEQAILYWAWQRLDNRSSILAQRRVKIFVSPSTVAGEGEVKLLEWIYSKSRRGESVAILGGDSDLVLEGLVIPVASTHNVFVLLPDGNKRYLSVSLWETTRTLERLVKSLTVDNMMKIRTDLTLLLILNGNDYLPKLRGSSGFNRLFQTYLRLQRQWYADGKKEGYYLVDPNCLEFNLPFCIAFFSRLAAFAPAHAPWFNKAKGKATSEAEAEAMERTTPLQQLNNFVDAGYLPKPVKFQVIRDDDDEMEALVDNNNDDSDDENDESEERDSSEVDSVNGEEDDSSSSSDDESDADRILVRLLLGEPGTDDFSAYEIWHSRHSLLKVAKQKLAKMALEEFIGSDDDDDDEDVDEDGDLLSGLAINRFEWEIRHPVEEKVDAYLYGLLWNLQTYQDGTCADYAYNYGKRLSPTASDIVDYLEKAHEEQRKVGPKQLYQGSFSPPMNAGLACLAALPSKVKHLVPEPYRWLDDETVEDLYASCVDPEDNSFSIRAFERLCEEQVKELKSDHVNGENGSGIIEHDGRRILLNDHSWTVVSLVNKPLTHPFDPPVPFSDRLSKLRKNSRIRVNRILATKEPRPRKVWGDAHPAELVQKGGKRKGFANKDSREFSHSDPAPFMSELGSLDLVDYKTAYSHEKKKRKRRIKAKVKMTSEAPKVRSVQMESLRTREFNKAKPAPKVRSVQMEPLRTGEYQRAKPVPEEPVATLDGVSAIACLKQLEDAGIIGQVIFEANAFSDSAKARERVRLTVSSKNNADTAASHDTLLVFERDREVNKVSRQSVKHHLASLALCEIIGPEAKWSEKSFKELKHFLTKN